jgi:DNA-binding winged helix-turn-helix (wHTH) protein
MLYRFDGFEIEEMTRELRSYGERVPCQPKVFDLIILLLQHRHRVVSREMILREIWPGVCVSGASVNRLVKETRRTLGAPCDETGHIRTSRGRGYRFVGDVECVREPGEASEEDALVARARRALEASMDDGLQDFKMRLEEFVSTCHLAIEAARTQAQ